MFEIIFSKEECDWIIEHTKNLKKKRQIPSSKRFVSYEHYTLDLNEETKWIYEKFNSYLEKVTNTTIIKDVDTIMVNHYILGDGFEKHQDLYFKNQTYNVAVHLNENYEGGEFVFSEPDYIMPKITGSSYVFGNTRWHEVKKISQGERWSMIAFYKRENMKANNKFI
jgi:predicted 2-oxoglutarate/Fe(II)-dependent dioxygenase YbiX